MKGIVASLLLIVSSVSFAGSTEIEAFIDQSGVPIYTRSIPISEYTSLNENVINFNNIKSEIVGKSDSITGMLISTESFDHDHIIASSYIDENEVLDLIDGLKAIWNFTNNAAKEETTTLEIKTKSGFSVGLVRVSESEASEAGLKRIAIITTGDAYLELKELTKPDNLLEINGLSLITMDGIKDIISILEKANKERA